MFFVPMPVRSVRLVTAPATVAEYERADASVAYSKVPAGDRAPLLNLSRAERRRVGGGNRHHTLGAHRDGAGRSDRPEHHIAPRGDAHRFTTRAVESVTREAAGVVANAPTVPIVLPGPSG